MKGAAAAAAAARDGREEQGEPCAKHVVMESERQRERTEKARTEKERENKRGRGTLAADFEAEFRVHLSARMTLNPSRGGGGRGARDGGGSGKEGAAEEGWSDTARREKAPKVFGIYGINKAVVWMRSWPCVPYNYLCIDIHVYGPRYRFLESRCIAVRMHTQGLDMRVCAMYLRCENEEGRKKAKKVIEDKDGFANVVTMMVYVADGNASAVDSASDGGDDGGAVPLSGPSGGSRADGGASSLCADGTGMDDADEDDRRAAGSPPSTDKRRDCDRLTCRALLSDIHQKDVR
ncbi:hypothetical protein WN55_09882 [Dufourea novaeangliae]|uniref:Uncharacterized protein n=1 Tax=Dufourea novaeangliae TaxID=178035 RepID=A0A154P7H8_DUFNO|nr:hypothetical protein WN55_09882 [Dufourea novaeangliae]